MKITLSKSQWEFIGKKANWIKSAGGHGRFSEDLSDMLEAQVMMGTQGKHNAEQIFRNIKSNPDIIKSIQEEKMSDIELKQIIEDNMMYM